MSMDYDWWPAHGAPLTSTGSAFAVTTEDVDEDDLPARGQMGFTVTKQEARAGHVEIQEVVLHEASAEPAAQAVNWPVELYGFDDA